MNAEDEIERLRAEVEQLKQQFKQQLDQPKSLPALRDNFEFVTDMARFSENLAGYSQKDLRRKWKFTKETWTAPGNDDRLVEKIEAEKLRRVRDGSFKREKAQQLIVKGPEILDGIATSPKASDKHKIDALKVLNDFSGNGPQAAAEQDRVVVVIDLGGDTKLTFNKAVKPDPNDLDPINGPLPGFMIAAKKDDGGGQPI